MIHTHVLKALNEQLNFEFHSAYHYLALESYFHSLNLKGFAKWMHRQYREELAHAMKIYEFIHERENVVHLTQINEPPRKWTSPLEAFKDAFHQEQRSSEIINDLVDLALEERDHATEIFLKWFVQNQVEETARVGSFVQKLELVGNDKYGLFLIDRDIH